ncbi:MAG: penicillin-binding transpeptidase domain-containing protein [Phycisphaerales bacterium]
MDLRRLIPSMFHRRVALLMAMFVLASLALTGKLAWLTVARGADLRAEAEAKLVRQSWVPTHRGRILDRKGRVLAHDRAGYDVLVDYDVLSGRWQEREATTLARHAYTGDWSALSDDERAGLVAPLRRRLDEHVNAMWSRLGDELDLDPDELRSRGDAVVDRVEAMHERITRARIQREIDTRRERGLETNAADMRRVMDLASQPIAEQRQSHVIVPGVDDKTGFHLMSLQAKRVHAPGAPLDSAEELIPLMPGLEVQGSTRRVYPYDERVVDVDLSKFPPPLRRDGFRSVTSKGVAWHLIGRMRDGAQAEDVDRRDTALRERPDLRAASLLPDGTDRGEYFDEDAVGVAGVEQSLEARLRGLRGLRRENLLTGEIETLEPVAGRDAHLTIDVELQARVRALLDPALGLASVQPWHDSDGVARGVMHFGDPLNAAAVVLDIKSGEILALVSTPGVPRDADWHDQGFASQSEYDEYLAINSPYVNRAVAKPYPPGSIVKPLMVCGAERLGKLVPGETIKCTGHLLEDRPDVYRCWIYKKYGMTHSDDGHGLTPSEAIEHSCNIFFYEVGRRLGRQGIADVYTSFGLGRPFHLGIGPEFAGELGPFNGINDGSDLESWDPILLGIGQGPAAWTPLHAADAYATLARGGDRIAPHLIADGDAPIVRSRVNIPPEAREQALRGLWLSANDENGTGHAVTYPGGRREPIFDVPGIRVWGKTGTATAPDLVYDPDGEEGPLPPEVRRTGDHSWFVVLAGPEGGEPEYVIAVVVDYAGSGGRVSGPIANQIIRALVSEGYLPSASGAAASEAPKQATEPRG